MNVPVADSDTGVSVTVRFNGVTRIVIDRAEPGFVNQDELGDVGMESRDGTIVSLLEASGVASFTIDWIDESIDSPIGNGWDRYYEITFSEVSMIESLSGKM